MDVLLDKYNWIPASAGMDCIGDDRRAAAPYHFRVGEILLPPLV